LNNRKKIKEKVVKQYLNFRAEILKALQKGTIDKVEAKECLMRGFGKQEIPIFFDFPEEELTPLRNYILGLEKMGLIQPLFRIDDSLQE
jgi:hypothetical protein